MLSFFTKSKKVKIDGDAIEADPEHESNDTNLNEINVSSRSNQVFSPSEEENSSFTMGQHKKYDVCLVFPTDKETRRLKAKAVQMLQAISTQIGKNHIYIYKSIDENEIYALLAISMNKLKNFADLAAIHFPCDPERLRERCRLGWDAIGDRKKILPLEFEDRPEITRFGPFDHIYLKYECEDEYQDLYAVPVEDTSPFTDCERIKIINRILEDPADVGGLDLKLRLKLRPSVDIPRDAHGHPLPGEEPVKDDPVLLAAFPLHNRNKLFNLRCEWFSFWRRPMPWDLPFQLIREYFGEKLVLYYHFLSTSLFTCHFYSFMINLPHTCICYVTLRPLHEMASDPVYCRSSLPAGCGGHASHKLSYRSSLFIVYCNLGLLHDHVLEAARVFGLAAERHGGVRESRKGSRRISIRRGR